MIYTLCINLDVLHLKKTSLSFKWFPLNEAMLRHVLPDYDVLHENFVFWHVQGWASLGCVFRYFLPLPREMIQCDLRIFVQVGWLKPSTSWGNVEFWRFSIHEKRSFRHFMGTAWRKTPFWWSHDLFGGFEELFAGERYLIYVCFRPVKWGGKLPRGFILGGFISLKKLWTLYIPYHPRMVYSPIFGSSLW